MGSWSSAGQHRAGGGLNSHHLQRWIVLLQEACTTCNGSSGAHSCHQAIQATFTVAPDLFSGGGFMHSGIGGIIELLEEIRLRDLRHKLLRQCNGTGHPFSAIGELQFCAIGPQHGAPFGAHRVRHGEDQPVAAGCCHHRQGNSGVAAGGFHQNSASWRDRSCSLSRRDHRTGDAILDR